MRRRQERLLRQRHLRRLRRLPWLWLRPTWLSVRNGCLSALFLLRRSLVAQRCGPLRPLPFCHSAHNAAQRASGARSTQQRWRIISDRSTASRRPARTPPLL
jgi:hypothetical protein